MNLEQFRAKLQAFDKKAGANYYDNGIRQISQNEFSYEFDGMMTARVIFNPDGTIIEYLDEALLRYASFDEWEAAATAWI